MKLGTEQVEDEMGQKLCGECGAGCLNPLAIGSCANPECPHSPVVGHLRTLRPHSEVWKPGQVAQPPRVVDWRREKYRTPSGAVFWAWVHGEDSARS